MPPEIATRVSPAAARLARGHGIGKSYRQLLFLSSSPKWAHTIPSRSSLRRLFWGTSGAQTLLLTLKGQPAGLFGRHVRNSYGLMPASYPTRVSAADESK